MAAVLLLVSAAIPAAAKVPGYDLSVATGEGSATFTLSVHGVDDSTPASERCCGAVIHGLLEVFPADAIGPDLRPLPGERGTPIVLHEVSAGVYTGTVLLADGKWTVVPFGATDVSSVPYDFNETYPAVSFEVGERSEIGVAILTGAALLVVVVVSATLILSSPRRP